MNIRCRIVNGTIKEGRENVKRAIKEFDNGEASIKIEEWKDTRSNLQNAFIHLCFDVYAKEIGYSPLEAKFLLKKEFGLNRLVKNKRTGKQELLVRDTSGYNMEECAVFIDRLLRHFEHDCGIIIDPEIRKQYKIDTDTGELTQLK